MLRTDEELCGLLTEGMRVICWERVRQQVEEGYTESDDDRHGNGELACAAAYYALPDEMRVFYVDESSPRGVPSGWPFGEEYWKPGDRVRELAKAGALIAAEIDRLLRAGGS